MRCWGCSLTFIVDEVVLERHGAEVGENGAGGPVNSRDPACHLPHISYRGGEGDKEDVGWGKDDTFFPYSASFRIIHIVEFIENHGKHLLVLGGWVGGWVGWLGWGGGCLGGWVGGSLPDRARPHLPCKACCDTLP